MAGVSGVNFHQSLRAKNTSSFYSGFAMSPAPNGTAVIATQMPYYGYWLFQSMVAGGGASIMPTDSLANTGNVKVMKLAAHTKAAGQHNCDHADACTATTRQYAR